MSKIILGMDGVSQFKIPEVLNWEDYRYSSLLECSCETISIYSDVSTFEFAVGICDTPYGLMACYECPHCGDRVRWNLRSPECLTEYHPEWKL